MESNFTCAVMWLQWHWKPNIWWQNVSAMEGENVWVWSWSQTEMGTGGTKGTPRGHVSGKLPAHSVCLALISRYTSSVSLTVFMLILHGEHEQTVKSQGGKTGLSDSTPSLLYLSVSLCLSLSLSLSLSLTTPSHNRVWVSGSSQKPLSWWQVLSVFRPSGISERCIFER